MTILKNRTKTALLVVDVQAGVVAGAFERDAVVANIVTLWRRREPSRSPSSGPAL